MYLKSLLTAAAATALIAGAAQAQETSSQPVDPNPPVSADAMPPVAPSADTAVNPTPGTMVDPGVKTTETTTSAIGTDASATVTTSLVTNGPVADTPENRAKYRPLSNAGRRTAARGN